MLNIYYGEKYDSSFEFLKFVLEKYHNTQIQQGDICVAASGKPYLNNGGIHFNIAHTDSAIVVAVSNNGVGVDIERQDRQLSPRLIQKYFTGDDKNIPAAQLWTVKEAFVKYRGQSIISSLKDITFLNGKIIYRQNKLQSLNAILFEHCGYYITAVSPCQNCNLTEVIL